MLALLAALLYCSERPMSYSKRSRVSSKASLVELMCEFTESIVTTLASCCSQRPALPMCSSVRVRSIEQFSRKFFPRKQPEGKLLLKQQPLHTHNLSWSPHCYQLLCASRKQIYAQLLKLSLVMSVDCTAYPFQPPLLSLIDALKRRASAERPPRDLLLEAVAATEVACVLATATCRKYAG
jgi:hypothetical protein